ncbi:transcriptional regulator, LacI family [Granulicella rosea]|uniref:Transcriptional regulator, LacI family n=1 Tax=Granulicella rosea TaxID=474952 RepID=A0A239M7G2_9BACT|nr:LacI family DNA-binding transcriptional regulator [Granulicella rosea]SNT38666.1 transcriptional regulator, LacI family [Granulicella rosea]
MAVRLKDIAKDLGVSTVTVSKVLRGNTDIGERTRQLVLDRMRELNYQPNMMARGLASGRSYTVGLVVPDLVHPFFGEFAKSLGGALRRSGRALIIASSEEDPEIERQEIRTLLSRGVDVMLVASCQPHPEAASFSGERVPFVLIDRNFPAMEANFVGSNDVKVGELATRHLIELGRRRIAHIGAQEMSPSLDRLTGYKRALAAAGIPAQKRLVVTRKRFEETGDSVGYQAMQELLAGKVRPDAVFCYNDLSAIGAMQAAMHAGLRIPQEIAFVGCGNLRYAEYLKIPLTSIDHATDKMGEVAAKLALELAADPKQTPQTVLLDPRLVVRQSSAVL